MKLDFSKYKIKPEQTEIEAIEDKNRWLENNGYLTLDEVQKLTDSYIEKINGLLETKEKEILEI